VMWFRRDPRLADNPALLDAVAADDGQVLGLFVLDPALIDRAGEPRRDHLVGSLKSRRHPLPGRRSQAVPAGASFAMIRQNCTDLWTAVVPTAAPPRAPVHRSVQF
jgi:deoxyribodipyrimidine photolyase